MCVSNSRILGFVTLILVYVCSIQHSLATSGSKAGNRQNTFIALSFSHKTGSYGYAKNQRCKRKAIQVAKRECRKHANDCTTKHTGWTNNTCMSIATDPRGGWGMGNGSSKRVARKNALRKCSSYKSNKSCKTYFTVCQD